MNEGHFKLKINVFVFHNMNEGLFRAKHIGLNPSKVEYRATQVGNRISMARKRKNRATQVRN